MTSNNYSRIAEIVAKLARRDVISALKHTHLRNLHSIVLRERTSPVHGMERIYFAADGHGMESLINDGEFTLMPHSHRQDITLELLFGDVSNVMFHKADKANSQFRLCYEYKFHSPILGGDGAIESAAKSEILYGITEKLTHLPVFLHHYHTHSMEVHSKTAAWIVREFDVAPAGCEPECWSLTPNRVLEMTGMYEPASRDDIADMCHRIIHAI